MEQTLKNAVTELKNIKGTNEEVIKKALNKFLESKYSNDEEALHNVLLAWLKLSEVLMRYRYPIKELTKVLNLMDTFFGIKNKELQ